MNMYKSLLLSILTQLVTGIIEILFLFIKVPIEILFLKQLLILEVIVQIIEGSFYTYWFLNFKTISNITPKRYFDWAITTPTMLVTLIFYLIYLQSDNKDELQFFDLWNKEFYTLGIILVLNWLMLLFGYLGEIGKIPVMIGVPLGFIPFILYYCLIYKNYVLSDDGLKIFSYFLIVWSIYGIVAVLPYKLKNTCYNVLDLFSKNFFGIFLSYLLYKNKISNN